MLGFALESSQPLHVLDWLITDVQHWGNLRGVYCWFGFWSCYGSFECNWVGFRYWPSLTFLVSVTEAPPRGCRPKKVGVGLHGVIGSMCYSECIQTPFPRL